MKATNRFFALMLAVIMMLGVLPAGVFADDAQGEVHYLAFASDLHSEVKSNAATATLDAAKFPFGNTPEYVALIGDMVGSGGSDAPTYKTSSVKTIVQNIWAGSELDIIYGSHDAGANDDAGILNCKNTNSSGLVYTGLNGDGSVAYYVYGIAYNDMETASNTSAVNAFTAWAATVTDMTIPVFICSHMPMHDRRDDNKGANNWLTAINAASEGRNVVFFWGHNHTSESSADTNAYHVAPGGSITPEGGISTKINFTYMNAGYLKDKTAATFVTLSEDKITLSKYTNGKATDYSVTRVKAPEDNSGDDTEDGNVPGKYEIPGEEKTIYVLTDSVKKNGEYIIVNSKTAGNAKAIYVRDGSGHVSAVDVKVVSGASFTSEKPYIESIGTATVLQASAGSDFTLKATNGDNVGEYLKNDSSYQLRLSSSSHNWNYQSNALKTSGGAYVSFSGNNFYSGSSATVYLYQKTTVNTKVEADGSYSVECDGAEFTVESGKDTVKELALEPKVTFTPESGDPIEIEVKDYELSLFGKSSIGTLSGNQFTFNGKEGTAQVKVTATVTNNGVTYKPFTIVTVKAVNPGYEAEIISDEIKNGVITKKGIQQGDTVQLGSELCYVTETGKTPVEGKTASWKSSDTSVAAVDANGKVTLTGKDGLARIEVSYEISDGEYETAQIVLSVSTSDYVTPADGTGDFPEYPNQGSIRFDKTAEAVGNFSQTGVTQVELSMTGVPYTSQKPIDAVLVLDMTSSMTIERLNALREATLKFIDAVGKNADGSFSENRIAITTFNVDGPETRLQFGKLTETSYKQIVSDVNTYIKRTGTNSSGMSEWQKSGGTPWSDALQAAEKIMRENKDASREQFVIFMTDGGPTSYQAVKNNVEDGAVPTSGTYYKAESSDPSKQQYYLTWGGQTQSWYGSDSPYERTDYYRQEYYSSLMKSEGVTIYSVGLGLNETITGYGWGSTSSGSTQNPRYQAIAPDLLKGITSAKGETFFVDTGTGEDSTAALTAVFKSIASSIVEAAKDVVVSDKIADEYTLVLKAPNDKVAGQIAKLKDFEGFRVEFVEYQLDENHERTTGKVLETVRISDTDKVTVLTGENGEMYSIDGDYFDYDAETRMLTWKVDKLTNTEYALRYYLYLDHSEGYVGEDDEAPAGTYPTNDWATLSYQNFNGNDCQQTYPIPQMTWNGAQVSYVFYLVNEKGQPVNKAGQVVDFANASFVTDVNTASIVWNEDSDVTSLVNAYKASEIVPSDYTLYDPTAQYEIAVYAESDGTVHKNQFVITGSSGVENKGTTKVYNTKAGTKYSTYGTYTSANANGFDFANTTVAFAVVWKPKLNPDVIVVDYGIPVGIDVCANDMFDNVPHAISKTKPTGTLINEGLSTSELFKGASLELTYGSIEKVGNTLRYTPSSMTFSQPEVIYYDTEVTYYENSEKYVGYMYSSLTIIPATIIYYEDDFVTFSDEWKKDGTGIDKTQSQDRPGASDISTILDADNVYGFDPANGSCTTYSLGKAMKATASASDKTAPTATFTFTGTGFDIISMTNTTTGTIIVDVKDADGKTEKNLIVDSYYGCACTPQYYKRTYRYSDAWHIGGAVEVTEAEYEAGKANTLPDKPKPYTSIDLFEIGYKWETTTASYDTLYQIPVINCYDLAYGTHTVTVRMFYHPLFQHVKNKTSYDFYFDAVRIYNPAQGNTEAESTYVEDHEGFPVFTEIRDHLIDGEAFSGSKDVDGIVFIDGFGDVKDGDKDAMFNYTNFGPNNEVYLTKNQAIAFKLDAEGLDRIHIGAKRVTGSAVLDVNGTKTTIATATDMYYDITDSIGTDGTVIIKNSGEGILSLTNLKFTYKEAPSDEAPAMLSVSRDMAYLAANTVRTDYIASKTVAFTPKLSVYTNGKTVKIGDSVNVTVTAPADVTALTVNGVEATAGKTNAKTGRVTWTAALTADTENAFTVSVVAENEYGCVSKAKTTELKTVGQDEQIIRTDIAVTDTPAAVLESIFG